LDWKFRDAARVESEILSHAKSGSIILSHDIHKTTVDAMPYTLDALTAKGFKFVTVSELLALDRPAAPKTSPASKSTTSNSKENSPKKPSEKQAGNDSKDAKAAPAVAKSSTTSTTSSAASGRSNSTDASPKSASTPKPPQLSQEELRKKWLHSMNQP